jgi:hypothetical protein
MKSEWIATYEGSGNKVTGWFTGEKLFVNNELQDEQFHYSSQMEING